MKNKLYEDRFKNKFSNSVIVNLATIWRPGLREGLLSEFVSHDTLLYRVSQNKVYKFNEP